MTECKVCKKTHPPAKHATAEEFQEHMISLVSLMQDAIFEKQKQMHDEQYCEADFKNVVFNAVLQTLCVILEKESENLLQKENIFHDLLGRIAESLGMRVTTVQQQEAMKQKSHQPIH